MSAISSKKIRTGTNISHLLKTRKKTTKRFITTMPISCISPNHTLRMKKKSGNGSLHCCWARTARTLKCLVDRPTRSNRIGHFGLAKLPIYREDNVAHEFMWPWKWWGLAQHRNPTPIYPSHSHRPGHPPFLLFSSLLMGTSSPTRGMRCQLLWSGAVGGDKSSCSFFCAVICVTSNPWSCSLDFARFEWI
jgi:hypothetical protein